MVYVVLALVYAFVLVPLLVVTILSLKKLPSEDQTRETYEGIATSCLIAVCAALILTKGKGVDMGMLSWLAFVVVCGLLIRLPGWPKIREALSCAVAPSMCLLGALLAIYFIPLWLIGEARRVISSAGSVPIPPERALPITLFASLASIPAIAVAIFARTRVIALAKELYGANPTSLGRMEKAVNTTLRITTTVIAAIAVIR